MRKEIIMEKICCSCGKKLGLLTGKTKLSDGGYLCHKCEPKAVYKSLDILSFHYNENMTVDNFPDFVQLREDNRQLVADFQETNKFFDVIHIDANKNQIIILENSIFKKRDKLLAENPPVFSAADLTFWCTTNGSVSSSSSSAKADVYTVLGFESPLYEPIKVKTGKIEAISGIFKDHILKDPRMQELHKLLDSMKVDACAARAIMGEFAPAADTDCILKMVSKFYYQGHLDRDHMKAALDDILDGNRVAIKEAKKKYKL